MTEIELPLILNLMVFIAVPFCGGLLANKMGLPRMIGYIISGMILGIIIKGNSSGFLPLFANFGLIFLLFTIGLELNIGTLKRFGKLATLLALFQVAISWIIFLGILLLFGLTFIESAILGFACALSSTAVVSKFIQEKGEESSLMGSLTMGILILQDVIVIPFMILFQSVGKSTGASSVFFDLVFSLAKAGLVLVVMYVLAQRVIPILLSKVALISRELLNLFTILIIMSTVALFSFLGVSPAIAAFIAGVLIGGTLEHYQIFSQIRPLRDIFTILFFVFLGATIDLSHTFYILPKALAFALFIIFIKFFVLFVLFVYFRFHTKTAFSSGILLAQVGEFAFIVMHQAQSANIVSAETYTFAIASTLLTLSISPILMERKDVLYKKGRKFITNHFKALDTYMLYRIEREPAHIDALSIKDHVVICGYGRVGGYIGRALTLAKIPFIAIDYNYRVVDDQRKKDVNIIYGDPTDIDILDFAQVEYASALVAAVPDVFSQEMIILNAKILNPKVTIFTRVGSQNTQKRLKDLGAEIVVQPEFEAALSIIKRVFSGYNVPQQDTVGKIKRLKLEHGME
ncbi:cation:proton antiporter [Candidatus Woesebacteria bacterium]|nr:cation:proton antiporter [Candidatus Woesebacteria bacterium]